LHFMGMIEWWAKEERSMMPEKPPAVSGSTDWSMLVGKFTVILSKEDMGMRLIHCKWTIDQYENFSYAGK